MFSNQKQLAYDGNSVEVIQSIPSNVIKPSNVVKHNHNNIYLIENNSSYCNGGYRCFDNENGMNISVFA